MSGGNNPMLTNKLSQFIATNYLEGDASILEGDTQLISLNIVDSASIFELVDFIRQEEGVNVKMQDINPSNFASIDAIAGLVKRLKSDS
jgi:acyl carrier protein